MKVLTIKGISTDHVNYVLLVTFVQKFSWQRSKPLRGPDPHKVLGDPPQALPVDFVKTVGSSQR